VLSGLRAADLQSLLSSSMDYQTVQEQRLDASIVYIHDQRLIVDVRVVI
jgi:hypothetical protein